MGKQVAAESKKQAFAFYINSRLSAIKVSEGSDILMTDKRHRRKPMVQSDMYLENFTQIRYIRGNKDFQRISSKQTDRSS